MRGLLCYTDAFNGETPSAHNCPPGYGCGWNGECVVVAPPPVPLGCQVLSRSWLAANLGATVPVVEHVAVTVRVVAGVSDPGSKVHVAEPVLTKSASDTPVTASLKVSVKENDVELVGEVCVVVNDVTVGAVVSMTMALAPAMLFDPVGLVVEVIEIGRAHV